MSYDVRWVTAGAEVAQATDIEMLHLIDDRDGNAYTIINCLLTVSSGALSYWRWIVNGSNDLGTPKSHDRQLSDTSRNRGLLENYKDYSEPGQ